MKNFHLAVDYYLSVEQEKWLGDYHLVWLPTDKKGNGIYHVMDLTGFDLNKIDPNKLQIIK